MRRQSSFALQLDFLPLTPFDCKKLRLRALQRLLFRVYALPRRAPLRMTRRVHVRWLSVVQSPLRPVRHPERSTRGRKTKTRIAWPRSAESKFCAVNTEQNHKRSRQAARSGIYNMMRYSLPNESNIPLKRYIKILRRSLRCGGNALQLDFLPLTSFDCKKLRLRASNMHHSCLCFVLSRAPLRMTREGMCGASRFG